MMATAPLGRVVEGLSKGCCHWGFPDLLGPLGSLLWLMTRAQETCQGSRSHQPTAGDGFGEGDRAQGLRGVDSTVIEKVQPTQVPARGLQIPNSPRQMAQGPTAQLDEKTPPQQNLGQLHGFPQWLHPQCQVSAGKLTIHCGLLQAVHLRDLTVVLLLSIHAVVLEVIIVKHDLPVLPWETAPCMSSPHHTHGAQKKGDKD